MVSRIRDVRWKAGLCDTLNNKIVMTISFRDKHVLITGGSEGIGLALAHQFLNDGASATLLARNVDKLRKAQIELKVRRLAWFPCSWSRLNSALSTSLLDSSSTSLRQVADKGWHKRFLLARHL